jgi:hypothetical protein
MGHFVYVSVFGSICILIIAQIIFVLVVLIMENPLLAGSSRGSPPHHGEYYDVKCLTN